MLRLCCPIVGDRIYAPRAPPPRRVQLKRGLHLAAVELRFASPDPAAAAEPAAGALSQPVHVSAPEPPQFEETRRKLARHYEHCRAEQAKRAAGGPSVSPNAK